MPTLTEKLTAMNSQLTSSAAAAARIRRELAAVPKNAGVVAPTSAAATGVPRDDGALVGQIVQALRGELARGAGPSSELGFRRQNL